MTNEQKARMDAIEEELNGGDFSHYDEWEKLNVIEQEEYAEKELPKITKYFEENIRGKKWEDINPGTWDFYSD